MDKNKENIPKIRFPGFTDPWEQRRLGDIFYQTVEFINPQISNIELWSLTIEKGLTPKTDRYDREFLVKKEDKFKVVNPKDFVYNPMNMTLGAIGYNEMDKAVAVSGYYVTMKSNNLIDDFYMKIWLQTPQAIQLYKMHATGSLIEKQRVQFPTLSEIKFRLSRIEEQQQIGKFFKNIDNLISLHQRKLEHLQDKKKGLLQKMFPKEGEKVPELRFPGFTDLWEQCKLRDVLSLLKDGTHGTHNNVDNGVYLLSAKNIKNGMITIDAETDRMISEEEYKKIHKNFQLKKGDVLLTIVGSIGESAIIEKTGNITFQRSVAYLRPNDKITSKFLLSTINTSEFKLELKNRQVVSAQPGIYLGVLEIIPFQYPTKIEQDEIGVFFQNLDKLITLHQRKLEHLQQQKKGLLQQMFI